MPKKTKISDEDLQAFEKAVAGVRKITPKKIRLASPTPLPKRSPFRKNTDDYNLDSLSDTPTVSSEEFISYKHSSISDKLLRKLKKGQYNVDAVLDLHGMTVSASKKAVIRFIQECLRQDLRVALIIHGKGRHCEAPILKNSLNDWLRKIKMVLAFCSATISHGSRGAVYVLLKNSSEENIA
jgi:DNA-nicking Smr family endonuclease